MSKKIIQEEAPCQSKIGLAIPSTGKGSARKFVNAPAGDAKAVPPIPTAGPNKGNSIPLPEVELCLPSPTLTTNPETVTPITSAACASDATLPMTPNTMLQPESAALVLSATTDNQHSLNGKTPHQSAKRSQELRRILRNDETQTTLYQIQLENYKPFTTRIQASIDIWGSSAKFSGGEYAVRAKQIAAACQVAGMNDPNATPAQRLAVATALHKGTETYDRAFEQGLDKTEWKNQFKIALEQSAEFFGLGNKKTVKARAKAARKAA